MKFSILGAGSAAMGLAGYLSLKGYVVNMFNPESEESKVSRLVPIRTAGGIQVSGVIEGFARVPKAVTDIEEVIRDADVIIIAARAFGHKALLEPCIPYLKNGQLVIVMTGYWVSLRLQELLKSIETDVIFAETTLLPLVSEAIGPGKVKISGIKSRVKVAAFPSSATEEVVRRLADALPQLVPGTNILETNLDSFNPIFHTAIALFNLGELERIKDFQFYYNGVTPKVATVIDSMDKERLHLVEELGLEPSPAIDSLKLYYGASGTTTYEIFQNCEAYKGYVLPNVFDYIREDVPYGLVPIASLCDYAHLPSKAIKSIISAWSLVDSMNYWKRGFTAERLGLSGMEISEVVDLVTTGRSTKTSKQR